MSTVKGRYLLSLFWLLLYPLIYVVRLNLGLAMSLFLINMPHLAIVMRWAVQISYKKLESFWQRKLFSLMYIGRSFISSAHESLPFLLIQHFLKIFRRSLSCNLQHHRIDSEKISFTLVGEDDKSWHWLF